MLFRSCTGATVGSIFGIMHGIEAIPQKWITPIGRKIKTACLNLGELGYFGNQLPQTVDAMTARTERIARQVLLRHVPQLEISADQPTDLSGYSLDSLRCADWQRAAFYSSLNGPVCRFDFFNVAVDYGEDGALIRDRTPKQVRLRIENSYKTQATLNVRWYTPDGWRVSPAREGCVFSFPGHLGGPVILDFQLESDRVGQGLNRCVVELTADGRPTVMLVPVVLQNANLMPK